MKISSSVWRASVPDGEGQLISKGHAGFFSSPKKRTKNICYTRQEQKFEFSSSFFGRIGDIKNTFRN